MTSLRSFLFVIWLYVTMAMVGIFFAPIALLSESGAARAPRAWYAFTKFGLRFICGVRIEIRGKQYIPTGPSLVAAKHQSMLDTIAPFDIMPNLSIVLKRELLKLPIFGWFCIRSGMIPIDREGHAIALRGMIRAAVKQAAKGRPILIFPEGTRQEPGAPPDYKPGVAALYRELNLPCTPVAANTGLCWPPHGLQRYPGRAVIEFLPPIAPGLSRKDFMDALERAIETASTALMKEGR